MLRIVCAWCGRYMGDKEGEPMLGWDETSTICEDCESKESERCTLAQYRRRGSPHWAKTAQGGVKTMIDNRDLIVTSEAAGILHVSDNTLRRWADDGLIQTVRICPRGDRRYSKVSVLALADTLAQNAGYLGNRGRDSES